MFSAIAIDQAYEQKKNIKGDDRAIGLTEDHSALRRWMYMVAGPKSLILEQLEDSYGGVRADTQHQEETEANQNTFLSM